MLKCNTLITSQNRSVSISAFSRKQTFHIAAGQGRDIGIDRRITFAFWDVNVSAGWVFYFVSYHGEVCSSILCQHVKRMRHRLLSVNSGNAHGRCPTYRPTAAGTVKPFWESVKSSSVCRITGSAATALPAFVSTWSSICSALASSVSPRFNE